MPLAKGENLVWSQTWLKSKHLNVDGLFFIHLKVWTISTSNRNIYKMDTQNCRHRYGFQTLSLSALISHPTNSIISARVWSNVHVQHNSPIIKPSTCTLIIKSTQWLMMKQCVWERRHNHQRSGCNIPWTTISPLPHHITSPTMTCWASAWRWRYKYNITMDTWESQLQLSILKS